MENEAPSSEVKHWALENAPSAWTVTTPVGWMTRHARLFVLTAVTAPWLTAARG